MQLFIVIVGSASYVVVSKWGVGEIGRSLKFEWYSFFLQCKFTLSYGMGQVLFITKIFTLFHIYLTNTTFIYICI